MPGLVPKCVEMEFFKQNNCLKLLITFNLPNSCCFSSWRFPPKILYNIDHCQSLVTAFGRNGSKKLG